MFMIRKINSWILLAAFVGVVISTAMLSFGPGDAPAAASSQTQPTTMSVESADAKFNQARKELAELYSQVSYLKAKLSGNNAEDAGVALEKLMVINDLLVRYQAEYGRSGKQAQERAQTLQSQLDRIASDNSEQVARLRSHTDELTEKVASLGKAINQTQSLLTQTQTERDELKATLQVALAAAEKSKSSDSTISQLQEDCKKLQAERDNLAEKLKDAADKQTSADKTFADMQLKIKRADNLVQENEKLSKLIAASDSTITQLQENITRLEASFVNERKGLADKLTESVQAHQAAEDKLKKSSERIDELEASVELLRNSAATAGANQIASFQRELIVAREENAKLTTELATAKKTADEKEAKSAALPENHDKVVGELQSQIKQLYQAVGDARAQAQNNEQRAIAAEEKLKSLADKDASLAGQTVITPAQPAAGGEPVEEKLNTLQESSAHRIAKLIAENQAMQLDIARKMSQMETAMQCSRSLSRIKADLITQEARSGLKAANERIAELEGILAGLYTTYTAKLAAMEEENARLLRELAQVRLSPKNQEDRRDSNVESSDCTLHKGDDQANQDDKSIKTSAMAR